MVGKWRLSHAVLQVGPFPPTTPRLSFMLPQRSHFSPLFLDIFRLLERQACDVAGFTMQSPLFISLIVFLTARVVKAAPNNGKCYNANQIQVGSALPCDPEAEVSSCCYFGYICLSNGLCEPNGNLSQYDTPYFTSFCTDYSWNSPSTCLEICNNNKTRQVVLYVILFLRQCSFDHVKQC